MSDQHLAILVLRDTPGNVTKRLRAALKEPSEERDSEAYIVSIPVNDLSASVLDRLAALISWEAVDRLNVGAVAGALATDASRDAPALPPGARSTPGAAENTP